MSGVMLALRKTDSPGLLPGLFSRLTRGRLITKYPHAGIIVDGELLHITAKHGMHATGNYVPDEWDLFSLDVDRELVLKRFHDHLQARYDWLSLLAFVVPWRLSVRGWLYCFEWCHVAITGSLPRKRVTPEGLLFYSRGYYGCAKNEN